MLHPFCEQLSLLLAQVLGLNLALLDVYLIKCVVCFDESFDFSLLDLVFELIVRLMTLEDLKEEEVILCQKLFNALFYEFFSNVVMLRLDVFIKSDVCLDFLKIFNQGLLMV